MNAKMDHLITYQWKRLLEIQEIQIDLLNIVRTTQQFEITANDDRTRQATGGGTLERKKSVNMHSHLWNSEIVPDQHTLLLLRKWFNIPDQDDEMVFAHWHNEGDNFIGKASNVVLEFKFNRLAIRRIGYELMLSDATASLDDVFSGEGTVYLRNDFDLKHMDMQGHITDVTVHINGHEQSYVNGELPSRYKPAFTVSRSERVADLWKTHIHRLFIKYNPPQQIAFVCIREDERKRETLTQLKAVFHMAPSQKDATLYFSKVPSTDQALIQLMNGSIDSTWTVLHTHGIVGVDQGKMPQPSVSVAGIGKSDQEVELNMQLGEPGIYGFCCLDCRVVLHGTFVHEISGNIL
jgi:hypothetical protein